MEVEMTSNSISLVAGVVEALLFLMLFFGLVTWIPMSWFFFKMVGEIGHRDDPAVAVSGGDAPSGMLNKDGKRYLGLFLLFFSIFSSSWILAWVVLRILSRMH